MKFKWEFRERIECRSYSVTIYEDTAHSAQKSVIIPIVDSRRLLNRAITYYHSFLQRGEFSTEKDLADALTTRRK